MALTAIEVKNARYGEGKNKRPDGFGLNLVLHPNGSKYWQYRYRFAGKEKSINFGLAEGPGSITLAAARKRRDEARELLEQGRNPSDERKADKAKRQFAATQTFGALALEWFESKSTSLAPATIKKKRQFLDNDILPAFAGRQIDEITTPEIVAFLRRIESRGAHDVAKRTKGILSRIFSYGIQTGRAKSNPAAELRDVLASHRVTHRPALIKESDVAELLRACDAYTGAPAIVAALRA
jgi:hypothetical protein